MPEPSSLVTAVLTALAGARTGQAVVVLGRGAVLRRALEAATGRPVAEAGPADVVVAMNGPEVPLAVSYLGPSGRLVALAADSGAATRTAKRHHLVLCHSERVEGRCAWSAVPAT